MENKGEKLVKMCFFLSGVDWLAAVFFRGIHFY